MRSVLIGLPLLVSGCVPGAAPPPTRGDLAIVAVDPAGVPHDWFEIENRTDTPLELSDYVFSDRKDDFARARRFPEVTLAPGARHVQPVVRADHGFQLGRNEAVWLYHREERLLISVASPRSPRSR